MMVGLPCSGKTTLAKSLERELGAFRLTPDEWHRFLHGQDAAHPHHDIRHSKNEALQWNIAASLLERGIDVILDFGLWSREERDDFRSRATVLGAATKLHFLDVPHDELLERLETRNKQSPADVTIIPKSLMKICFEKFETPCEAEMV